MVVWCRRVGLSVGGFNVGGRVMVLGWEDAKVFFNSFYYRVHGLWVIIKERLVVNHAFYSTIFYYVGARERAILQHTILSSGLCRTVIVVSPHAGCHVTSNYYIGSSLYTRKPGVKNRGRGGRRDLSYPSETGKTVFCDHRANTVGALLIATVAKYVVFYAVWRLGTNITGKITH